MLNKCLQTLERFRFRCICMLPQIEKDFFCFNFIKRITNLGHWQRTFQWYSLDNLSSQMQGRIYSLYQAFENIVHYCGNIWDFHRIHKYQHFRINILYLTMQCTLNWMKSQLLKTICSTYISVIQSWQWDFLVKNLFSIFRCQSRYLFLLPIPQVPGGK